MKMMRMLISALFIAAVCGLFAVPGGAADADFAFDAQTGAITGYTGPGGDVAVPDSIGGVQVRRIGQSAFNANRDITSVALPAGVRRIEHSAFYFCENLRRVSLPEGLEVIAPYALFACESLEHLEVPASVAYIGDQAVAGCYSLRGVDFAGEVPLLGEGALERGPEERIITVPAEDQAAYEAALGVACQPGGARVLVDRAIPEGDFAFDAATGTITGYHGDAAYVVIPQDIGGVPVQKIGAQAFFGRADLVRLDLPEGVDEIQAKAFYASGLAGVTLPESLQIVGDEAFGAAKLLSLSLPEGLSHMGEAAFAANALRALTLPEGISDLPERAFQRNGRLSDLALPASLQRIGPEAFAGCGELDYVVFAGSTLPALDEGAFSDCPLADVDIAWNANKQDVQAAKAALSAAGLPAQDIAVWRADRADQAPYPWEASFVIDAAGSISSYQGDVEEMTMYWSYYGEVDGTTTAIPVRALGEGLFEGSGLRRFFVPHSDALEIIGDRAFAGSGLEYIDLFDSVTVIGEAAFKDCKALARIVIPDSVERIGPGAFEGCDALAEVVFVGGSPEIAGGAFLDCALLDSLVLPAGAKIAGQLGARPQAVRISDDASDEQIEAMAQSLALPWFMDLRRASEPDTFAPMPDDLTPNAASDFEFDPSTGTITKYIGQAGRVVVPPTIENVPVERIDTLAFSDATVLGYLTDDAAETGLTGVVLPETVRFIEDSAFLECRALKEVTCYGPVDRLGIRAFENCTALERVWFVNGVREIAAYCFNFNAALETAQLGDKVLLIDEGAFNGAGLAGELTLTAPKIGRMAFRGCKPHPSA